MDLVGLGKKKMTIGGNVCSIVKRLEKTEGFWIEMSNEQFHRNLRYCIKNMISMITWLILNKHIYDYIQ